MSKQLREPEQSSQVPSETPADQLLVSRATKDERSSSRAHPRRPGLSKRGWRLMGLLGVLLAGLLIVGLLVFQQFGIRKTNPHMAVTRRRAKRAYGTCHPAFRRASCSGVCTKAHRYM